MKQDNRKKVTVLSMEDTNSSLPDIQSRIFTIRGVQIMLDRDLAMYYKVETGQLNRQVKRNIRRFPEDFMFQLTKDEWSSLKCQFGTSNTRGGDRRALPLRVLTNEQNWILRSTMLRTTRYEKFSYRILFMTVT